WIRSAVLPNAARTTLSMTCSTGGADVLRQPPWGRFLMECLRRVHVGVLAAADARPIYQKRPLREPSVQQIAKLLAHPDASPDLEQLRELSDDELFAVHRLS